MATDNLAISGLALAIKLSNSASSRSGLVKIKVGGMELSSFLEDVTFADANGEPATAETAVYSVRKHTGSYSHHTTYTPVAHLTVDVQEYPTQEYKDHKVHIGSSSNLDEDPDGEFEGDGEVTASEADNAAEGEIQNIEGSQV